MTNNPFADPASSSPFDYGEHLGALLLIEPTAHEPAVQTSLGTKDAVRATITVLDGPNVGTVSDDVLIFPRVLISQTRSKIGQMVLGRLGQGVAKPGQSPPWQLQPATDQDKQVGMQWLQQRQFSQPSSPPAAAPQQQAPPQPAAAAQPQGQQVPF